MGEAARNEESGGGRLAIVAESRGETEGKKDTREKPEGNIYEDVKS